MSIHHFAHPLRALIHEVFAVAIEHLRKAKILHFYDKNNCIRQK